MCELFAMSARHPATVSLSLEEFSRHGGLTGPHKDGWGIGWYDQKDIRLVKEIHPAASSACVRFLQTSPFSSALVISHIRKATLGSVASRNCQPFVRELGGVWHCFAHNGDLLGIASDRRFRSEEFRPVGETDSEQAFCALMDALRPLWASGATPPLDMRKAIVSRFGTALRELGPANFCIATEMRSLRMRTAGTRATARSRRPECGASTGDVLPAASWLPTGCGLPRRAANRKCSWLRVFR
jgi:predicted glutamine amidotransferase